MSLRSLSLVMILVVVATLALSVAPPPAPGGSAIASLTVSDAAAGTKGQERSTQRKLYKQQPNEPAPIVEEPDVEEPAPASAAPPLFGDALAFGVTAPSVPWARDELDTVTRLAGERPSVVMWYRGFADDVTVHELDLAGTDGALPLLTWEPYDWTRGSEQPEYALARIIAGDFDAYLRRNAVTLRDWKRPVLLRFAHEMNGDWYPWSEARNNNRAGEYVAAWRHIHGLFAEVGADNVQWVWSPNVEYSGSLPLAGLYPGAKYVDVVAVDGYNWGTSTAWHLWQSPAEVFDATMAQVRTLAPGVPLIIGETASSEVGGNKAAWVKDLFTWMTAQPDVAAFVWFHYDKETDWRIDSSAAAAAAFHDGLAQVRAAGR